MDGLPVTLIVKAPNQQIEDQTIQCKETWTIHELKGHLSEVYPCKPKKEEQKLIYSGQLLTDSVVLKDILRKYEGQDTHTLHLVCSTPHHTKPHKGASLAQQETTATTHMTTNSNSNTSGSEVRRRNLNSNGGGEGDGGEGDVLYWQRQMMGGNFSNPWYGYTPLGGDPVAYMAWMQQMQAQYMQFYTQMMQNGGAPMMGYQPFPPNTQMGQYGGAEQAGPANQEQQIANPPPNQNPAAVNLLNNNNNGAMGGEVENWDWLEYFYLMTRVGVMLAIIYFYSSPARFLLVLVTGFFIYLYQIRYFHTLLLNNDAENNNNDQANNNNNNNAAPNNQQQAGDNNIENRATQDNAQHESQENGNEETNSVQINNQPSRLAITWTFITSFLTSLLPDAPNPI